MALFLGEMIGGSSLFECVNCSRPLDPRGSICDHCTTQNDPPNVRLAKKPDELAALDNNYSKIVAARTANQRAAVALIETFIKKEQRVAVARSAVEVAQFLSKPNSLYQTYHQQVFSNGRYAGTGPIDTIRVQFENAALPNLADKTVFGSLSVADKGQPDFGNTTMILSHEACKPRTTFFWGNPYVLSKTMKVNVGETFPLGYRSTWDDGYKLVTCKHYGEIDCRSLSSAECHDLLNKPTTAGDPDYIEAHYWKGFPASVVSKIVFSATKSPSQNEVFAWEMIKLLVASSHQHIKCEEI